LQIITCQKLNGDIRLQKDVNTLEFKKQQSHIALSYIKSQIEIQSKALYSYCIYKW
jgi:hypothetical protein